MAVALRYVSLSNACVSERLVRLLPNISHKSQGLEEATIKLLDELKLDIKNCRGQSYDNASNMAGAYTGLQSRIKTKNPLADFVDLMNDNTHTPDTRLTAQGLIKTLNDFQTNLITVLWNEILQREDKTSNNLQKEELDLLGATRELQTLSTFFNEKRNCFDDYEAKAMKMASTSTPVYERTRKRTVFSDEERGKEFEQMKPRDRFRTAVFLPILDSLITQLDKRRDSYESLSKRFEIFRNLHNKEHEDIIEQAKRLAQIYQNDIEGDNFEQECHHFKIFMNLEKLSKAQESYKYIKENNLGSTFPNLEVALRIFVTLPITSCTAERSFSALKRIKTDNRSSMNNAKLNSLLLLSTQSDITLKLDYKEVIDDFARAKTRKKAVL